MKMRVGESMAEEFLNTAGKGLGTAGLAFPDGEEGVAELAQLAVGEEVAAVVAAEFGEPVGAVGGGDAAAAGAGVQGERSSLGRG